MPGSFFSNFNSNAEDIDYIETFMHEMPCNGDSNE